MARTKTPHEFDTFIDAVCKDLGIPKPKICWRASLGKGVGGKASTKNYILVRKDLDVLEIARIIAHELRHIYQFKHKMLALAPTSAVWMGQTYPSITIAKAQTKNGGGIGVYEAQPWEDDANTYAHHARGKFFLLLPTTVDWSRYF